MLILFVGIVFLGLFIILTINDYDTFINLLIKYSYFPLNKIEDLKNEYLTIERFRLLRYATLVALLLFSVISNILFKHSERIYNNIENFGSQLIQNLELLWKSFMEASYFEKTILSLSFLYITVLLLWGSFSYPLIYDEVFSYLYFVDKGFLVTVSYYPGPNNHVLYLLCCNFVDVICNNPIVIMRLPAIIASLIFSGLVLLYFNKKFSAHYAVLFILLTYSSFSIFYYSFHGRGYSFVLLFFVVSFFSAYEYISKRVDFYLVLFSLAAIAGTYTIPIFVYPLFSFVIFFLIYGAIKKDDRFLYKTTIAFLIIGIVTIILYCPVLLLSGLNSLTNNSWVKPLEWNDFMQSYGTYARDLQNHLWDVTGFGWVISKLAFIGGAYALYKLRKPWWIVLSITLLICPFAFLPIQKVLPFMRVFDYLYLIFIFLLTSFIVYLLPFIKSKIKNIIASVLLVLVFSLGLLRIIKETPSTNQYYHDLDLVLEKVFASNVSDVYSKDDTYSLFFKYYFKKNGRDLNLLSNPMVRKEEILIIHSNEELGELKDLNPQLLIENQEVKVYRIYKK